VAWERGVHAAGDPVRMGAAGAGSGHDVAGMLEGLWRTGFKAVGRMAVSAASQQPGNGESEVQGRQVELSRT
jgi:hypothetical protein